jgi:hypothetical protein
MHRQPKIYLETTIFNFPFADDSPDKKLAAQTLFAKIKEGKFLPFTSTYVVDELEATEPVKQAKMMKLISDYEVEVLPYNDEAEQLADKYIAAGIIPAKHRLDAIHLAFTAVNALDFIVSYNFQHIKKQKTIAMTAAVNVLADYPQIGIYIPEEIIND